MINSVSNVRFTGNSNNDVQNALKRQMIDAKERYDKLCDGFDYYLESQAQKDAINNAYDTWQQAIKDYKNSLEGTEENPRGIKQVFKKIGMLFHRSI
ncbi:hypothetical protein II906_07515 [bacterium]|nr:hypothetical protein [bacterium]